MMTYPLTLCKNCLRYFDATRNASTEYCDSGVITTEEFSRWLKES